MSAARPLLCLVTDRRLARASLPDAVAASVAAGVDVVQIREKDLGGRSLLALCDEIAAALGPLRATTRLVVNRRCDVALAAGLDGVHLGFDAAPPRAARALLGAAAWIGASTHAPGELAPADEAALSYAQLAPIFAPLSKAASRPPLGLAALGAAARGVLPILAQGGVDVGNAGDCIRAGAAGVAVTGAILAAADPAAAAGALRRALDAAAREREGAGR